jgi:hypothetical protein
MNDFLSFSDGASPPFLLAKIGSKVNHDAFTVSKTNDENQQQNTIKGIDQLWRFDQFNH